MSKNTSGAKSWGINQHDLFLLHNQQEKILEPYILTSLRVPLSNRLEIVKLERR